MAQVKHSKHKNQIRIIGGTCRGRKLSFQEAEGLRPTPDSVREKLFNWLGQDMTGMTVLDLFAGSGALGLEAASRNAKHTVLVENHRPTWQNLQKNIRELNLAQTESIFSDGLNHLKNTSQIFDVIFLDPPFAWQGWTELFTLLKPRLHSETFIYIEAGSLPELPDWATIYREGKAGMSHFVLLKLQTDE